MNELYYEKLRNLYLLTAVDKEDLTRIDMMLNLYNQLIDFSKIARTKGLLELEEVAVTMNGDVYESYLRKLIMLIVDGTEPDKLEEIGITTIFSGNFDSFDSIICMMCLRGALLIQEGESPYNIGNTLRAFFPPSVIETYHNRMSEDAENRKKDILCRIEKIKKKCDESYYGIPYRTRLSEYIMQRNCKELSNIYYWVKTSEWSQAFWGLSGDAVNHIIDSLDVNDVEQLIDEVEHRASIRLPFAEEMCEVIYKKIT